MRTRLEALGHLLTNMLPPMEIVRRESREAFITADGSSIRELAGAPSGNATNQSLAEAVVPPGGATIAHYHRRSEEIYLFTGGSGRMRLGDEERGVRAGDCVVIAPGVTVTSLLPPTPVAMTVPMASCTETETLTDPQLVRDGWLH